MGRVVQLAHPVNVNGVALSIMTDPSTLSSVVLGDLLFWYSRHGPIDRLLHERPNALQPTDGDMVAMLKDNDEFYTNAGKKVKTAVKELEAMGGDDNFPLAELMSKVGLCIQTESCNWMIGLIPPDRVFVRSRLNKWALSMDLKQVKKVVRYFQLPDKKHCFVPGYFLRLFVFLHTIGPHMKMECWGDGVSMTYKNIHGKTTQQVLQN